VGPRCQPFWATNLCYIYILIMFIVAAVG
jgi:hypothetical protein